MKQCASNDIDFFVVCVFSWFREGFKIKKEGRVYLRAGWDCGWFLSFFRFSTLITLLLINNYSTPCTIVYQESLFLSRIFDVGKLQRICSMLTWSMPKWTINGHQVIQITVCPFRTSCANIPHDHQYTCSHHVCRKLWGCNLWIPWCCKGKSVPIKSSKYCVDIFSSETMKHQLYHSPKNNKHLFRMDSCWPFTSCFPPRSCVVCRGKRNDVVQPDGPMKFCCPLNASSFSLIIFIYSQCLNTFQ